ncbi:MAG: leucine-rich repeat protein [Muribaculaceae bacterium]|nr:leucine-rich repeat protein [Muribaculaceae bacterium]
MKRSTIIAILAVLSLRATALDVSSKAGCLSEMVTDVNITTLTVTGTMNATDFYYIADNLHHLNSVNLAGVRILPCTTAREHYWEQEFAADELPAGAFGGMDVTSVTLPAGLKTIGKAAFAGCTRLTSVTWPSTLDSIADFAFAGCSALQSVVLPASVEVVGNGAFMRCTSLKSLTVAASSRLRRIDATAMMDCPALTTLAVGNAVQSIGERSLAGTGLKQLNLSSSTQLTSIGDWAVVLTPVTDVKLPSSLKTLGDGAFLYDKDLASVSLGGKVSRVSDYALAGTGLNGNLNLAGVSALGDYALYNVSQLSVVELPATVTWIGTRAMAGMTGMTSLTSNAVAVPALGEEVWAGVKQSTIPLTVPAGSIEKYKAAAQWQNFLFESTWLRGDVNNDGEVNIADVNTLVDIILGGKFDDGTMRRADVNEDGEIGLADINTVLDMILGPSNKTAAVVDTDDLLRLDDVTMRPGDERTLDLVLDNASSYSALQCDITLPQGLTLMETSIQRGRTAESRAIDAATQRTAVFSMEKLPFEDKRGIVISITVRADASLTSESQIMLSNIIVADDENVAWHLADYAARVSNSTGIEDLNASADRVWVEGRTLCIDTRNEGDVQIAAINGTARNTRLTAGINRQEMEPGFYVVVLNGKSYKIAIK